MDKRIATIRKYEEKDYDNLRAVCAETATGLYAKPKYRDITPALFFEHYAEYYGDSCFVVADENDKAVGYCICAPDYMQFVSDFRKNKLKKVRKLSRIEAIKFSISHLYINNSVAKEYPAHLHINIMPDFQRMGLGGELIDELLCHLNGKGVPRLHLGTNDANKKACNFYKKFGFHIIKEVAGSVIFGIDIPAYVSSRERKEISK